jgi:hypothetical protein
MSPVAGRACVEIVACSVDVLLGGMYASWGSYVLTLVLCCQFVSG